MKKDYYMHQQFLLNVDFRNIYLTNYIYTGNPQLVFEYWEEKNLFDVDVVERCISLAYILKEFDDEAQWNNFLQSCAWIDRFIILVDIRISEDNKMTQLFLASSLKALVRRFLIFGKDVAIFVETWIALGA